MRRLACLLLVSFVTSVTSPLHAEILRVRTRGEAVGYVHQEVLRALHAAGHTGVSRATLSADSQQEILRIMDERDLWGRKALKYVAGWAAPVASIWLWAYFKVATGPPLTRAAWASFAGFCWGLLTGVPALIDVLTTDPGARRGDTRIFGPIIQRELARNVDQIRANPHDATRPSRGAVRWNDRPSGGLDEDLRRTP